MRCLLVVNGVQAIPDDGVSTRTVKVSTRTDADGKVNCNDARRAR